MLTNIRKKLFISVIIFFVLFTSFSLPKAIYADTFTISGTVKNSSGVAVPNSTVSVNSANSDSTTTNSAGEYNLIVPTGTYNIQVTPPSGSGYSSAIALNQSITTSTVVNFILTPVGNVTLSGHVFDEYGNPVSDQKVAFGNTASTTNSSGVYSITVAPGTNSLYIDNINSVPNYSRNVPTSYSLTVSSFTLSQTTILDITIPAKKVIVYTLDPSNNPVAGSSISVGTYGMPTLSLGGNITAIVNSSSYSGGPVTDNTGKTAVWVLPTTTFGSYAAFYATPPSGSIYQTTLLSNQSVTSDTTKTINYQQPAVLSGHIYDENGTAISGQKVTFGNISSTSDNNGFYSLSTVPGTQNLTIDNTDAVPDYSKNIPTSYKVQVNSYTLSQTKTQDITIPARKVTMNVFNALNLPVQGAVLSAGTYGNPTVDLGGGLTGNLISGSYSGGPVTDIDGQASVWVFPSTSLNSFVNINVTAPTASGYVSSSLQNQNITVDTSKSIVLQRNVTLSGHVFDQYGSPVSGQRVSFGNISSTTNASGEYSISGLSGIHMLSIDNTNSPPDYSKNVPTSYLIQVNDYVLSQTKTQDIIIPAYKITAHVQDPVNSPVSGVGITAGTYGNPTVLLGAGLTGNVINSTYTGGPLTDNSGNTILWLLPTTTQNSYVAYNVTLPNGSPYLPFILNNMQVTNDHIEIIALQYNHATPVTTATLETEQVDGIYSNPTTVTLSATAADGYTIENTYYKVDGNEQQAYTDPFTVSGNGPHEIEYWSVDNSGVQEQSKTKTFTIAASYNLSGNVYVDANRNGVKDTGEIDYQGATLNLSGAGIDTTTTDGSGNYAFTNKIAGTYAVTLVLPNEYEVTTANPVDVPLSSNTTVNFGIALIVVPTDTPTPTITPEPDQLTSLQPAKVWIGRKNNQYHDATAKYDLKAEVYKNGTLITSGVLNNVSAGNPGWAGTNLQTIPFTSFNPVSMPMGTDLSIKVSVKNNCSSPISVSNPRIWFNDSEANSSFGATIDGANRNYYLLINSALGTLVGEGPKQTADVTTDLSCSVYKPFGTWSVSL